ncbi:MAG TPA: hypothetical protein VJN94_16765 [Candidatus Binataceae bacterium]|nr:hypothetical protein [Candidatus Binataceae bacterium]
MKIYAQDRRHPIPMELAAQHLGYKGANSGTAVKALASIRYFGLLGRPKEGLFAIEKDVEDYNFAPDPEHKAQLIRKWLLTPPVFAEVLGRFPDGLPSDAALRFALIQGGFLPKGADALVRVLKDSVEFARYYDHPASAAPVSPTEAAAGDAGPGSADSMRGEAPSTPVSAPGAPGADRIPVRLSGGRRAFLEIPSPFYEADKQRLKNQIDLLLSEDGEAS